MKTAYFYTRLSSKKQLSDKSTGQERQKRIQSICKQNGWTPSNMTFQDLGVSAYRGKNRLKGDLSIFIKLAKENKLAPSPVLCVEALDRFSRQDIDESEPAIIDLLKCGVDICITLPTVQVFTNESTKSLADRIQILVALKSAFDYAEQLSKRIKSAQAIKRERMNNGEILKHHHAPHYYTYNKDKRQYDQNELTPIVKRIIKDFLNGESVFSIA
ncbi:MAG TPA: recombinase family protein, partial [Candidatus Acidoferrales bacterium]|nr:recombinase family protein [Candidatus Acidoferrales bacterium]